MEDDPDYDIAVARVSGQAGIDEALLVGVIEAALRRQRVSRAVISVALVDDADMAQLNHRHLGHDGPTDVLAFNMSDDVCGGVTCEIETPRSDLPGSAPPRSHHGQAPLDHATPPAIEGEIVISVDTAAREADRRKHSLEAELALYAVHGTLHLLGYCDKDEERAARMHTVEDDVLASAGLGRVYGTRPA